MAFQFAVYQPIQETSLYEAFLQSRELAMQRQKLQLQQDMAMDDYAASIMRDPNFTKDSPYNPYINQKLQETLSEAKLKYQKGELNAATFKSYVANSVGKINLWVQNADQIMKTIDEGIAYYKTKGADVTAIKNRAARQVFMNTDGSWKTGDEITQMMQDNKFSEVVNNVVSQNPEIAFKDMKAFDDWLNTVKTSKESITRSSSTTVGGQKGKKSSGVGVKGVADYYPMWQEVETSGAGVPTGVKQKLIPLDQLKQNDAVWLSLTAAVKEQKKKLGGAANVDANGNAIFTDQDIVNYATEYANIKRPYNFTEAQEKQSTNITYKVTNNTGGGGDKNKDLNIFNATFQNKLPTSRYFTGSGDVVTLQPGFSLKIGEVNTGYGKVDKIAKSVVLDKKNKTLTVTGDDNKSVTYNANSDNYKTLMTQLRIMNPWLESSARDQPELSGGTGFKTGF